MDHPKDTASPVPAPQIPGAPPAGWRIGALLLTAVPPLLVWGAWLCFSGAMAGGQLVAVLAAAAAGAAAWLLTDASNGSLRTPAPHWRAGLIALAAATVLFGVGMMLHVAGAGWVLWGLPFCGPLLQTAGMALGCRGAWLLAQGPTGRAAHQPMATLGARWGAVAMLMLWAIVFFLVLTRSSAAPRWAEAALAVTAVWTVWLSMVLQRRAEEVVDISLADQFHMMAWVMPCALLIAEVHQFQWIDVKATFQSLFFLSYPLVGGLLGLMVWVIVTLAQLSLRLMRQGKPAQAGLS